MKKLFSTSWLGLASVVLLVGCNGSTETKTQQDTTAQSGQYVSPLPSTAPTVKVVTSGMLAPFSLIDANGNVQGIDVDIIRAIGENQGFRVELYREPVNRIFESLDKGTYQVLIDDRSLTEDRAAKYGYTKPYFKNPSVVMYNPKTPVKSIHDLKNLRVATMTDTKQTDTVNAIKPRVHDQLNSPFLMYQGLAKGKYDAILQDKYLLAYIDSSHPEHTTQMLEYEPDTEPSVNLVIYTQKGDDELIQKLNQGITNLQQSGEIDKIVKKYIK